MAEIWRGAHLSHAPPPHQGPESFICDTGSFRDGRKTRVSADSVPIKDKQTSPPRGRAEKVKERFQLSLQRQRYPRGAVVQWMLMAFIPLNVRVGLPASIGRNAEQPQMASSAGAP